MTQPMKSFASVDETKRKDTFAAWRGKPAAAITTKRDEVERAMKTAFEQAGDDLDLAKVTAVGDEKSLAETCEALQLVRPAPRARLSDLIRADFKAHDGIPALGSAAFASEIARLPLKSTLSVRDDAILATLFKTDAGWARSRYAIRATCPRAGTRFSSSTSCRGVPPSRNSCATWRRRPTRTRPRGWPRGRRSPNRRSR